MAVQEIKIPTAEEFLKTKTLSPSKNMYGGYNIPYSYLQSLLIEFAKLHVQKALEQAGENAQLYHNNEYLDEFDDPAGLVTIAKDTILESYPLTNIK